MYKLSIIFLCCAAFNWNIYAEQPQASQIEIVEQFSPQKIITEQGKEHFKAEYKGIFRDNIVRVLSIAFNTQTEQSDSRSAMQAAINEFEELKKQPEIRPHYIMAYNALISFLENLSEPAVYKKYINMINNTDKIVNIADAFTWMANSMQKLIKYGYSTETMNHIVKRQYTFRHIYTLADISIFSNLFYEQRQFLLKMFDWCENILSVTLVGNGPGIDDGIDWYANHNVILFDKARIFDKELNKITEEINKNIADSKSENIVKLSAAIDNLNNIIKNAYLYKIAVRDDFIAPTKTMLFEICQKAIIGKNIAEASKDLLAAKLKKDISPNSSTNVSK